MRSHLSHQLKLAAPLLGTLAVFAFVSSWGAILTGPRIGDGLDELTATLAAPQRGMDAWATGHWALIAGTALLMTIIVSAGAIRRVCHARKAGPFWHVIEHTAMIIGFLAVPVAVLASGHFGLPLAAIFGSSVAARLL